MLKTQDVLDWFARSPQGIAILTEREEQHFATREQLATDLASAKADLIKELEAANKLLNKAVAKYREAEQLLRTTNAEVQRLASDLNNLSFRGDRKIEGLERELRESASNDEIDAFIAAARDEMTELCRGSSISYLSESYDGIRGEKLIKNTSSNLFAIRRRLAAIGVACSSAEALRLSASRDVVGELQKLRDSLPPVKLEAIGS